MKTKCGTRKAERGGPKAEAIAYGITVADTSEGWFLKINASMPHGHDDQIVENEYTRRTYSSASDALTGARHAINRFNTPGLGLKKGKV